MFRLAGFTLVLAIAASHVDGKVYTFLNMTELKPYDQIPCPASCGVLMSVAFNLMPILARSILKKVLFPVSFCQKCAALNLDEFTLESNCFMNPDKDIFDHQVVLTFPKFATTCECDLSNSASATADIINQVKALKGQCGIEKYENLITCKPLECGGSQGGEGRSNVTLFADLPNARILVALRIDTRKGSEIAFPTLMTITTSNENPYTFEGSQAFDEAGKCLAANDEGLTCHLFNNLAAPFFLCLDPDSIIGVIGSIMYVAAKC